MSNGSSLSLATGETPTLAGCLRNCQAVALAAMRYGHRIAVIPAGEKWDDGSLRPSFEDLIGAGAIITHLTGVRSPEAQTARSAYCSAQPNLKGLTILTGRLATVVVIYQMIRILSGCANAPEAIA